MAEEKFDIIKFLKMAVEDGISDVHLRFGIAPAVRKNGKIYKTKLEPLTEDDLIASIEATVPSNFENKIYSEYDIDYSFELENVSRFRINVGRELGKPMLSIRMIPNRIPTFKELKLPDQLEHFSKHNNGIILITGQTGSGKSTTIASMLNYINNHFSKHIITIEDPIEFVYEDVNCIITQRQLLIDTASFPDGVKYALRQDPDVILIGEIRDRETVTSALKAAETGHLVLATLHTNDTVQTINRIINFFEPSDRDFVRKQVAETIRGVVSQRLVSTVDGQSRVPACEILTATPTVKDFIIKDKLADIYELVKCGSYSDMITMNMSLFNWFQKGVISEEEAIEKSDNVNELKQMLRGAYHGHGAMQNE